jgi:putative Holliday junction resolvase
MATREAGAKPEAAGRVTTDPVTFVRQLPPTGALVAVDASPRRMGVAATDPERRLVTPLQTLIRHGAEADLARLGGIVEERGAVGLVVGFPVSMDGREGPAAEAARRLADTFGLAFGLPVLLQDERLTSFAVEAAVREGRIRPPKRGPRHLDHYAAAVILEDALRALRQACGQTPR